MGAVCTVLDAAASAPIGYWFCQLDLAPFDLLIWLHPPGESTPARPVFCCNKLLPDEGRVKVLG